MPVLHEMLREVVSMLRRRGDIGVEHLIEKENSHAAERGSAATIVVSGE